MLGRFVHGAVRWQQARAWVLAMKDSSQRSALCLMIAGVVVFQGGLIGQLLFGTLHHQLIWWCVALAFLGLFAQALGFVTLRRRHSR